MERTHSETIKKTQTEVSTVNKGKSEGMVGGQRRSQLGCELSPGQPWIGHRHFDQTFPAALTAPKDTEVALRRRRRRMRMDVLHLLMKKDLVAGRDLVSLI